jgi:hypothetical protein
MSRFPFIPKVQVYYFTVDMLKDVLSLELVRVHKNNGDKHVTPTIKNEIRKLTVTPSTIEIFDKMVIKMFPLFVNWRIGMVVLFHCKMFVYLAKAY